MNEGWLLPTPPSPYDAIYNFDKQLLTHYTRTESYYMYIYKFVCNKYKCDANCSILINN